MSRNTKGLIAYLIIVTLLSGAFIAGARALGRSGAYLAGFYMFTPALAAVITRAFFYEEKFRDAGLKLGRWQDYLYFWLGGIGIAAVNYLAFTIAGAIHWDFSGEAFLAQLDKILAASGQQMPLPKGMTPRAMLFLYTIGGLTIFNIFPGIIFGFGEEFGWRGFLFPTLYRIRPWAGFIVGGLIWFLWHLPLSLLSPAVSSYPAVVDALRILFLALGSIATFTVLAYAYVKTGNIFIPSILHGTINNASRAFSYWVSIDNQALADISLAVSMIIIVLALYKTGQFKAFEKLEKTGEPS